MNNEVKHTPTPWIQDGFEIYSNDCEYHPVANSTPNHTCRDDDEGIANAAHIFKCVNLHDELVGLIVKAREDFKAEYINRYGSTPYDTPYCETLKKAGAL